VVIVVHPGGIGKTVAIQPRHGKRFVSEHALEGWINAIDFLRGNSGQQGGQARKTYCRCNMATASRKETLNLLIS